MRFQYIKTIIGSCLCFLLILQETNAQPCFPGQVTTAAYAEDGSSQYISDVLWLTWGSTDTISHPYGEHNQPLDNGSGSYASIHVGGGRYLCVRAEISNLNGEINSYAPGNYSGDHLDDMYNIGGAETANQLVNGIRNTQTGAEVSFTITCSATLDGIPVRIAGLVLGDGESLAPQEYFYVTADGEWTVVELKKNIGQPEYEVLKTNVVEAGVTKQRMRFLRGNDNNTAAVSFLTFNESAYDVDNGYEVSFDATLKGNGLTAIALGLLTTYIDGGDAPESYGAPVHLFEGLTLSDDNIPLGDTINLNTESYAPGGLVPPTSAFLGSAGPDADSGPLHSIDALGDDNDPVPSNEEDAWPTEHKRWSYNATYAPNNTISVQIPYNGIVDAYISGWIDFNLNGVFDEEERRVVPAPANPTGVVTLTWTVPENRIPKSTYVRLRYGFNEDEISSPTSIATGGEVEDHHIYILGPAITNPILPSKAKQPRN